MKVSVKVTGSTGSLFGGSGQTVETKIEVDEHLHGDTASLVDLTNALTASAGVIVRDIAHAGDPLTDPDVGTAYDGDADSEEQAEDGTRVRDTGGVPEGAGDVVRLTWDDGHRRTFIDTGEHYYSPEVVGKFSTPMAVEYDTDVQVDRVLLLGETLTPQAERAAREHPSMQDARNLLTDAVLTADEAQEVRNLALAAERRGDERGITHGR